MWRVLFSLFLFSCSPLLGAVSKASGTFNFPSSTGAFSETTMLFTPTVIIFYGSGVVADGGTDAQGDFFIGATDCTRQWVVATVNEDGVTPSNSRTAEVTTNVIRGQDPASSGSIYQASFTSCNGNGWTINVNIAGSSERVHWVALGGDVQGYAGKHTISGTGVTSVDPSPAPGFTAEFILSVVSSAASAASDMEISIGAATSSTARWSVMPFAGDNLDPTDTCGLFQADELWFNRGVNCGVLLGNGDFDSFDALGFNIDILDTGGFLHYLILEGGSYEVGTSTQPTSPGTSAVTTTCQPEVILLSSHGSATTETQVNDMEFSFGTAIAGQSGRSVWTGEQDNITGPSTSIADSYSETDEMIQMVDVGPTLRAEAFLSSVTATSFVPDWTTVDATARAFGWAVICSDTSTVPIIIQQRH